MVSDRNRVCPVERSGSLDNRLRKWIHNPRKMLAPYLGKGMTALDVGCGPGFFSLEMGVLVGESGRVVAADLQEGMLQKVADKIRGTAAENRILLHKCSEDRVGFTEKVDFILAFYMVHEIPDKESFFREMKSILKPDGRMLLVEPPFHVNKAQFGHTLALAKKSGLQVVERPKMFLDHAACLR